MVCTDLFDSFGPHWKKVALEHYFKHFTLAFNSGAGEVNSTHPVKDGFISIEQECHSLTAVKVYVALDDLLSGKATHMLAQSKYLPLVFPSVTTMKIDINEFYKSSWVFDAASVAGTPSLYQQLQTMFPGVQSVQLMKGSREEPVNVNPKCEFEQFVLYLFVKFSGVCATFDLKGGLEDLWKVEDIYSTVTELAMFEECYSEKTFELVHKCAPTLKKLEMHSYTGQDVLNVFTDASGRPVEYPRLTTLELSKGYGPGNTSYVTSPQLMTRFMSNSQIREVIQEKINEAIKEEPFTKENAREVTDIVSSNCQFEQYLLDLYTKYFDAYTALNLHGSWQGGFTKMYSVVTTMRLFFGDYSEQMFQLIHNCAHSLESLAVHNYRGREAYSIFMDTNDSPVEYTRLRSLKLSMVKSSGTVSRGSGVTVLLPSLTHLDVDGSYAFEDDVLFRATRKTLKYANILVDLHTAAILEKYNVFRDPDYLSICHVKISRISDADDDTRPKIAEDTSIILQLEIIDSKGSNRTMPVKVDQNAHIETLEGLVRNQHKSEVNLAFDANSIKAIDDKVPRFLFPKVSFKLNSVKSNTTLQVTRVYQETEEDALDGLNSDADSAYMSGEEEEEEKKKAPVPILEIKQEPVNYEHGSNPEEYNKCTDYYRPEEFYDYYDSTDSYY
ncbi:hypothetical protein H4218_006202 [Coemansia sp. IMI 209128]|nr:hypothetical protein H4218_006202 [Coemansia sp. IMI 209128]